MAILNVTENDFGDVATAAMAARDAGDVEAAQRLDKIARRINAALTNNHHGRQVTKMMGIPTKPVSWRDMPSTI